MRFYMPNKTDAEEDGGEEVYLKRSVEVFHANLMQHVTLEATGAQVIAWMSVGALAACTPFVGHPRCCLQLRRRRRHLPPHLAVPT